MPRGILRRSSDRTDVKEEAGDAAVPDITIDLLEATEAATIRSTTIAERSDRVDSTDRRPTTIKGASSAVGPVIWRGIVPRMAAAVDPRSTTDATRADDLDV